MSRLLCVAVLLFAVPACVLAQCAGGIEVTKSANLPHAVVGLDIDYTIEITNVSDCVMSLESVHDDLLGDLTGWFMSVLPPGVSDTYTYVHIVESEIPDPLVNRVLVEYVDEFGDPHVDDAENSVDILHPMFSLTVECLFPPSAPGEDAEFLITVTNAGDVPLDFVFSGSPGGPPPTSIAPEGIFQYAPFGPCVGDVACFEVIAEAMLPPEYGLGVSYLESAEDCCPCEGAPVEQESWGMIKALYQ